MSLSLYLHIPFCRHRCSYCDFNTYTTLGELQTKYAEALTKEIAQVAGDEKRPCHTIFFGGGTPSLMSLSDLEKILSEVATHFEIAPNAEISLEANPGTVDLAYLQGLRSLGVNRLSFGVQSVIPSELALLEREHDFETVVSAVALSREAGFTNFNLDLIYGVPGQTLPSWQTSVRELLALEPTHLSLYCLTIEPGTPMQRWLKNGRFTPPDPDLAADQYEFATDHLGARQFEQYEISNWALSGQQCEHNLTYWRNRPYLGLGAGAHGSANGVRYQIVKQPRVYIRRLDEPLTTNKFPLSTAVAASHEVSPTEAMSDTVITQLRLLQEGLDLTAFETNFGQSLDSAYPGVVAQLVEWGLIEVVGDRLLLTRNGRFLSNQVFYRFMES